jgi:hypothetical protein
MRCFRSRGEGKPVSGQSNAPFQNRQSLISNFQLDFAIFQNGTFANSDGILRQNTLPTTTLPLLTPRACRLVRFSLHASHATGVIVVATLEFGVGSPVGACTPDSFTVDDSLILPDIPAEQLFCACDNISVLLDKCQIWRPRLLFAPSIVNPRLRLAVDVELR